MVVGIQGWKMEWHHSLLHLVTHLYFCIPSYNLDATDLNLLLPKGKVPSSGTQQWVHWVRISDRHLVISYFSCHWPTSKLLHWLAWLLLITKKKLVKFLWEPEKYVTEPRLSLVSPNPVLKVREIIATPTIFTYKTTEDSDFDFGMKI